MHRLERLESGHKETTWKVVRVHKVRDEDSPDPRAISEAAGTR